MKGFVNCYMVFGGSLSDLLPPLGEVVAGLLCHSYRIATQQENMSFAELQDYTLAMTPAKRMIVDSIGDKMSDEEMEQFMGKNKKYLARSTISSFYDMLVVAKEKEFDSPAMQVVVEPSNFLTLVVMGSYYSPTVKSSLFRYRVSLIDDKCVKKDDRKAERSNGDKTFHKWFGLEGGFLREYNQQEADLWGQYIYGQECSILRDHLVRRAYLNHCVQCFLINRGNGTTVKHRIENELDMSRLADEYSAVLER